MTSAPVAQLPTVPAAFIAARSESMSWGFGMSVFMTNPWGGYAAIATEGRTTADAIT